jgi:hypothetical protein
MRAAYRLAHSRFESMRGDDEDLGAIDRLETARGRVSKTHASGSASCGWCRTVAFSFRSAESTRDCACA